MWIFAGAGLLVAAVAAIVVVNPSAAIALVMIPLVGSVLVKRPSLVIHLTLLAAITTTPAFVPMQFGVGGFSLRLYELMLVGALLYALHRPKPPGRSGAPLLVGVLAAWGLLGYAMGNPLVRVVGDVRLPLVMVAAYVIARRVSGTSIPGEVVRWLPWSLWFSAAMSVLGSAGVITLNGTTEAAILAGLGSDAGAAVRLLTPATYAAVAVLCSVMALRVTGRAAGQRLWTLAAPAAVIVVVSFTRNSLLALAIALVAAILLTRSAHTATVAALRLGAVALVAWLAFLITGPLLPKLPGGDWVMQQSQSYSQRVLGGLDQSTLSADPSTQFRNAETVYLKDGIAKSPVVGHGMGFAYKPPTGPEGSFTSDYAPYYAHDFYLWITVKAGILGALLFLAPLLAPVLRAFRVGPTPQVLALAPTVLALLASSFVAPMPLGSPTSLILGALVGLLSAAAPPRTPPASRAATRERALATR